MKTFRLFKRLDDRDAPYYFHFVYRGARYLRCLETPDKTEAQRRARLRFKEITDAIQREDYPTLESLKLRATHTATVRELITAYRASAVDAGPTARHTNINALLQMLRLAHPGQDPETLPISAINAALARTWFTTASAKSQAEPDQSAATSLKRSANSRFIQASSLFTPKAIDAYQQAGCHHPALAEYVATGRLMRFSRIPNPDYNPPTDTIIAATLKDWETLDDRNMFLAIGLELAFGLRKQEVIQARWSWLTTREGYPVLDGDAHVKNKHGFLQVRALDPWYTILRTKVAAQNWRPPTPTGPIPATADLIIEGTHIYRTDDLFRQISDWLRAHGWETQKTNHALRAYAGSQIAMRYGIYDAQTWLRHSTVKVTEQHYSHFVKRFRPADAETIPARWAQSHAAPVLTIVPAQAG